MKFSKKKRKAIRKWALAYYAANREHYVRNPDFAMCRRTEEMQDMKCNICDMKDGCARGEMIYTPNPNIIPEMIDKVLDMLDKLTEKSDD